MKALLPYVLDWDITVSRYEPPNLVETSVRLSLNGRFGMHGFVRYRFEPHTEDVVLVTNEQEIAADTPLPRLLHPLAQIRVPAEPRLGHAPGRTIATNIRPIQPVAPPSPTRHTGNVLIRGGYAALARLRWRRDVSQALN